jgi:hypothetical protein
MVAHPLQELSQLIPFELCLLQPLLQDTCNRLPIDVGPLHNFSPARALASRSPGLPNGYPHDH